MHFNEFICVLLLFIVHFISDYTNCSRVISYQAVKLLQPGINETISKSKIFPNDSSITIKFHSIGTFKSYHPFIFEKLRNQCGITSLKYLNCFNVNDMFCLNPDSKSGQSFWKSNDNEIIIKTIKHYEVKNLLSVINSLGYHMFGYSYDENNLSSIASILGLYRIKLSNNQKVYFLILKNIYPSSNIILKYDLKGSTVGRKAKSHSEVKKDLDLIESKIIFNLGSTKDILLYTIQRDVTLLSNYNFMDYSLLVAIEKPVKMNNFQRFWNKLLHPTMSTSLSDKGKLVCLGQDGLIYHFGIIDFLQKYTFRKRLETLFKGLFYDWNKISCTSPKFYADRFVRFLVQHVK